jgi:tRNA-binding EMAP/Myf-like protein
MAAIVSQVTKVEDHPSSEKPHLGVFILDNEHQMIGIDNVDGSRRFNVGDLVVHIRPGSIIPEWLINEGFENLKGGKVKASNFAGVRSEGIMLNCQKDYHWMSTVEEAIITICGEDKNLNKAVYLGDDVSEYLDITEA